MKLPRNVVICEVGPRDGLQIEERGLTTREKCTLIEALGAAGVPVIEAGSFMHPRAVPQMANTDEVFQRLHMLDTVEYRALVGNQKGVERAIACGCKKVKLNVSASRAHNLANLNSLPGDTIRGFTGCAELARSAGLAVSGSIACPFGSPWDREIPLGDVEEIIRAYMAVGVTEISISDAPGMAVPSQVYAMCRSLRASFPQVRFILHFHNTRGMGMANILAGMQAGITWFDGSFAGLGGCPFIPGAAGNVSTEDIVHMCAEMGIETGIDLDAIMAVGRTVEEMVGHSGDSYVLRAGKNKDLILAPPTGQQY